MQDDQQISQSADKVIAETADDQPDQPTISEHHPNAFSLGSSPSSVNASDDNASDQQAGDDTGSQPSTGPTNDQNSDQSSDDDSSSQSSGNDDLDQIKRQALDELSPIISELDQAPEEKYRTLMMLIQASDDKNLIKAAFEAANNIEDKKAKAEALLNIVNEINYFSTDQTTSQTVDRSAPTDHSNAI